MTLTTNISAVYLIGIGGIGMSSIARFFNTAGVKVAGYDRTRSAITDSLRDEGIDIQFTADPTLIPKEITNVEQDRKLIIYTPAISDKNPLISYFKTNGNKLWKRSVILGNISERYRTIAVAGTHGKTTTASILSHILKTSEQDCTAFLGGISTNYNTNFLSSTTSNNLVVEADEFDRSFLTLSPELAIITSMDADHLDIYGDPDELNRTFIEFTERIKPNGTLIYRQGLPLSNSSHRNFTYSATELADYHVSHHTMVGGRIKIDLKGPFGNMDHLDFGMPGIHNMENAVAAIAASQQLGVSETEIRSALSTYKGVKRRFEVIIDRNDFTYIDDYAHHPAELDACIGSVRQLFPDRKITGIFQPHLFSRTRDHLAGFATSLSQLDKLFLLDIYPARELPIEGVTSAKLLELIDMKDKTLISRSDLLNRIETETTDILITLGAGDIDKLVEPLSLKFGTENNQAI